MSPQIAGFDFMASYEPTDNTLSQYLTNPNSDGVSPENGPAGPSSVAGMGGAFQLNTSPSLIDQARRLNTIEVGGRYQGAFGSVQVYAFGSYIMSGTVSNSAGPRHYDGLGAFFGGAAINYLGFRVGGSVLDGGDKQPGGAEAEGRRE